jgi:hypothetical protein
MIVFGPFIRSASLSNLSYTHFQYYTALSE